MREQNLPAMPEGTDPSRAVNPKSNIAVASERRLSRVDADANARLSPHRPRMSSHCALGLQRSFYGICRTLKGNEKRISLGVDLLSLGRLEGVAEQPLV